MQVYSDPSRESDPHALPDVEVWYSASSEYNSLLADDEQEYQLPNGWYYWYCFPGCLPDSEPVGPFESADEARKAAQTDC